MPLLLLFGGDDSTANANAATATGTAYNPTITSTNVGVFPAAATATGTAYAPSTASSPSAALSTGTAYTASVSVASTPLLGAAVGSASGALAGAASTGGDQTDRRIVLTSVSGATIATLSRDAVMGAVVKRLNDHDDASFTLPTSHADMAIVNGTRMREVQLWRGDDLLVWGPITDYSLTAGGNLVQFHVKGPTSHLDHRVAGPLVVGNRLTNPSFETGDTTGWSTARTTSTGFEPLLAGDVAVVNASTVPPHDGSYSVQINGDTTVNGVSDVYLYQEFSVTAGTRATRVTAVGWCYLASGYTNLPYLNRGLYLSTSDDENRSLIDATHTTDRWVRHSASIVVPAGETRTVHARICGPNGTIYWDELNVTENNALELVLEPQGAIIDAVVVDAQNTGDGKTSINLGVTGDLTSGPKRSLTVLHSHQARSWPLITNYVRANDGVELRTRYSNNARFLVVSQPRAGSYKTSFPLWMPGPVVQLDSWSWTGRAAANDVAIVGETVGGVRQVGRATDTSGFADSQVRQLVGTAPLETSDLNAEAAEVLTFSTNPEQFTVTMHPDWTDDILDGLDEGDWVPVNIKIGYFSIVGTYRVFAIRLMPDDVIKLDVGYQPQP